MRTLPRLRWLLVVLLTAVAVAAGALFLQDRATDVITFKYHHLSATIQTQLEVEPEPLAVDPTARLPLEPTAAAAILAVAGLALAIQQRDRNRRS